MSLRIVADRNIPYLPEALAGAGEVLALPSAELTPANVREADLLFVRSTVKVGPALLESSRVRFVATATIGIDHLDTRWLDERGITWASAPGSNADSVMQWMTAALGLLACRNGLDLRSPTVGIVGVGAVGSRVERLCRAFGWEPILCDPPRARREGGGRFVAIDELLPACDLVTFHVPLERSGEDATFHLLDERRLSMLRRTAWVVNASRGEVVDGAALARALIAHRIAGAALDVFEGEPSPEPELVGACALATPHIAGHSLDGKANGTQKVYEAASAFLGRPADFSVRACLPPLQPDTIELATEGRTDAELLLRALSPYYQLLADDAALRRIVAAPPETRRVAFQQYRQDYPFRRELHGVRVVLTPPRPVVARVLAAVGAIVSP